jgi:hypothetical protein
MRFTTGTSASDPGTRYDTDPVPVGDIIREIAGSMGVTLPANCPVCGEPAAQGELTRDSYPPARRRT